jgi:hypothetical protein
METLIISVEESIFGTGIRLFLYKKGVRLVNISSGYTDKYKDRSERYKPNDMNGETAYISKVCKKYSDLGMILVVTAGNEGDYYRLLETIHKRPW